MNVNKRVTLLPQSKNLDAETWVDATRRVNISHAIFVDRCNYSCAFDFDFGIVSL